MPLARWVPILNLIFILIELFDPSTSFIRASHESAGARPKLVIVAELVSSDEVPESPQERVASAVTDDTHDTEDGSFGLPQVGESHASLVHNPTAFFSQFHNELPLILNTGLVNQYEPLPHKRPPISVAV